MVDKPKTETIFAPRLNNDIKSLERKNQKKAQPEGHLKISREKKEHKLSVYRH
jgi:hypothetical protein